MYFFKKTVNNESEKKAIMDNLLWLSNFPVLSHLEPYARDILRRAARLVVAPIGTIGYRKGGTCGAYLKRLARQLCIYKYRQLDAKFCFIT